MAEAAAKKDTQEKELRKKQEEEAAALLKKQQEEAALVVEEATIKATQEKEEYLAIQDLYSDLPTIVTKEREKQQQQGIGALGEIPDPRRTHPDSALLILAEMSAKDAGKETGVDETQQVSTSLTEKKTAEREADETKTMSKKCLEQKLAGPIDDQEWNSFVKELEAGTIQDKQTWSRIRAGVAVLFETAQEVNDETVDNGHAKGLVQEAIALLVQLQKGYCLKLDGKFDNVIGAYKLATEANCRAQGWVLKELEELRNGIPKESDRNSSPKQLERVFHQVMNIVNSLQEGGKKVCPNFTFTATTPVQFSGNTIKAATLLGMVRMSIVKSQPIQDQLGLWIPEHLLPLFNPYMDAFWWFISNTSIERTVDTTISKLYDPAADKSRHLKIANIMDRTKDARKVLAKARVKAKGQSCH